MTQHNTLVKTIQYREPAHVTNSNGGSRADAVPAGGASVGHSLAPTEPPGLQELSRRLLESRRQLTQALHRVQSLSASNACLRQAFERLAQREAQARQLAYHDGLTGLPNRRLLEDRLRQAIAQAGRHRLSLALMLLDLDKFKAINDRLGHAAGDELLQVVAKRLAVGIRGADTACRYGGDEFVLMLAEIKTPACAAPLAAEVRERLGAPYVIDGREICITASVGTAVYPVDGQTGEELIKRADVAMYRAKGAGRGASIKVLPPESPAAAAREPAQIS
jgi:diguanylate cyclase (GGDEF)-like protein